MPRLALESALAELAEGIGKTPACAALTGEAGLGKTLLLHVLRQRLEGSFDCLYVSFPRLAAPELWRWVAVALGLGRGEDDRGAVLGRATRLAAEGMGLVLLVDDAGALPAAARGELIAACSTTGFSLVLAFDSADHPQLASLPAHVRRIDLGPAMTLAETRAYVHARLRRVDPDGAFAARLGPERLAALYEASGGVPARSMRCSTSGCAIRTPSPCRRACSLRARAAPHSRRRCPRRAGRARADRRRRRARPAREPARPARARGAVRGAHRGVLAVRAPTWARRRVGGRPCRALRAAGRSRARTGGAAGAGGAATRGARKQRGDAVAREVAG